MLKKKIRRVLTVIWEEIKSYLVNIADIGHGSFYVSATSDQIYSSKRLVLFLRIKLPEEAEIPMALTSLIMELKFQH